MIKMKRKYYRLETSEFEILMRNDWADGYANNDWGIGKGDGYGRGECCGYGDGDEEIIGYVDSLFGEGDGYGGGEGNKDWDDPGSGFGKGYGSFIIEENKLMMKMNND